MPTFDPSNAECLVLTFKEGLLARMAHDLKIRVTRFAIDVDLAKRSVEASFDASSLKVLCAVKNGREEPDALSEHDMRQVDESIATDVLEARRYPTIRFFSTALSEKGEGFGVEGRLELHGKARSLSARVEPRGGAFLVRVSLHQPDFGIRPYSGLMGAMKIKPEVEILLSLNAGRVRELVGAAKQSRAAS